MIEVSSKTLEETPPSNYPLSMIPPPSNDREKSSQELFVIRFELEKSLEQFKSDLKELQREKKKFPRTKWKKKNPNETRSRSTLY